MEKSGRKIESFRLVALMEAAPFASAVRAGGLVHLSGQIGHRPGEMRLVEGGLEAEARQALDHMRQSLRTSGRNRLLTFRYARQLCERGHSAGAGMGASYSDTRDDGLTISPCRHRSRYRPIVGQNKRAGKSRAEWSRATPENLRCRTMDIRRTGSIR